MIEWGKRDRTAPSPAMRIATLERELAEAKDIIAAALRALPVGYLPAHTPDSLPGRVADLVSRYAEAEQQLAARDDSPPSSPSHLATIDELKGKLEAERALADRLANALEDIAFGTIVRRKAGGCGQSLICTPEQLQNYAHRAFAAWKKARQGQDADATTDKA